MNDQAPCVRASTTQFCIVLAAYLPQLTSQGKRENVTVFPVTSSPGILKDVESFVKVNVYVPGFDRS
jgi:hypothetical protein